MRMRSLTHIMNKDDKDKADDVEDVKGDEDVVESSESINSN